MSVIKDNYPDGVCPDCRTLIPDYAVDGTECKNCGHVFHSTNTIRYKILLHWDDFRYNSDKRDLLRKLPPREGEITTEGFTIEQILDRILYQEQNNPKSNDVPPASELDVIELEDGRRFLILDLGFNELCSKDADMSCEICAKFYIKREDVPKAIHMAVRNTFYKNKNNLCEKCFRMWGNKIEVENFVKSII